MPSPNFSFKRFQLWALLFVVMSACQIDPKLSHGTLPYEQKDAKVIIIVMDGVRYSEGWADTGNNFYYIRNEIAPHAAVFTNFFTETATLTQSGHTAILTGYNETLENFGNDTPSHPNIFQLYRKQKFADSTDTWLIASKGKLAALASCEDTAYKGRFLPATYCGANGSNTAYIDAWDSITCKKAMQTIQQYDPHLMLINLRETDMYGHNANWPEYNTAIRMQDTLICKLYQFTQSLKEYAGNTYFIITNDHGRHNTGVTNDFAGHGDNCYGCRKIFLLATGPGIQEGFIDDNYHSLDEVYGLACHTLGIKPQIEKSDFSEIFE